MIRPGSLVSRFVCPPLGLSKTGQCFQAISKPLRTQFSFPSHKRTHNQEQVDVFQPQALQALLQALGHTRVVRRPHLGHYKHVLALHARGKGLLEPLPDFAFIAVAVRAVDELVPVLEGVRDGGLDLTWLGLPGSFGKKKQPC